MSQWLVTCLWHKLEDINQKWLFKKKKKKKEKKKKKFILIFHAEVMRDYVHWPQHCPGALTYKGRSSRSCAPPPHLQFEKKMDFFVKFIVKFINLTIG